MDYHKPHEKLFNSLDHRVSIRQKNSSTKFLVVNGVTFLKKTNRKSVEQKTSF